MESLRIGAEDMLATDIPLGASACTQKNLPQLKEVVKPFSPFSEVYNRYHNAKVVEIVVSGRGWAAPIRYSLRADVSGDGAIPDEGHVLEMPADDLAVAEIMMLMNEAVSILKEN